MTIKIEGFYRNGRLELNSLPDNIPEDTRAIVIFSDEGEIEKSAYGIDETQAQLLQATSASFTFDWNNPEMNIYDNYDLALLQRSQKIVRE